MSEHPDRLDLIQQAWARERPDLDVSPQGVIGRLHRVGLHLTDELVAVYRRHGLGRGTSTSWPRCDAPANPTSGPRVTWPRTPW
ncbi:hypothetical protein [Cellulomonas soli]